MKLIVKGEEEGDRGAALRACVCVCVGLFIYSSCKITFVKESCSTRRKREVKENDSNSFACTVRRRGLIERARPLVWLRVASAVGLGGTVDFQTFGAAGEPVQSYRRRDVTITPESWKGDPG